MNNNKDNNSNKPMPGEPPYNAADKFSMDVDSLEWLTDEEAAAYEEWQSSAPISGTDGPAPVFDLDSVKPSKPTDGKPSK